jgi:hypothetical protein
MDFFHWDQGTPLASVTRLTATTAPTAGAFGALSLRGIAQGRTRGVAGGLIEPRLSRANLFLQRVHPGFKGLETLQTHLQCPNISLDFGWRLVPEFGWQNRVRVHGHRVRHEMTSSQVLSFDNLNGYVNRSMIGALANPRGSRG